MTEEERNHFREFWNSAALEGMEGMWIAYKGGEFEKAWELSQLLERHHADIRAGVSPIFARVTAEAKV